MNLPQFDRFISTAAEDHIAFWVEGYEGNVVIMSKQSFEAKIVIIEIPKLNREIRRTGSEVSALLIVGNVIYGI